jgi:hypothetical protein
MKEELGNEGEIANQALHAKTQVERHLRVKENGVRFDEPQSLQLH